MEGVASNLGIMIDSITQQMQIKTLLEQSQSLTEELQSQSEQLQQQHEVLMSINEQLEKQNKESKIKTKELEETKKKLEEHAKQLALSSEFKSEFLANMSHELRTPLNSMLILTQILAENREGNLNQQQVEYAQSILLAGKDLLELINNILDLAKVEAGKMDIVVDEIHLHSFAKEMKQEFHHLAQKKVLISK